MSVTLFELRCIEFKSLVFTASAARTAGDMIEIQDRIGIVVKDTALAAEGVIIYTAEAIVAPKATGVVFAAGDNVYYDAGNDNVTTVSSGNTWCGTANEAAATEITTLEMDLKGDMN